MMIMTTITGTSIYLLLESTFPFTNLKENLHLWQGNLRSGMGGALPGSHLYTLHSQPTQVLNGEVANGVLIFNMCISYQTLPEPNTATSFAPSQTLPLSLAAFLPLSSHPLLATFPDFVGGEKHLTNSAPPFDIQPIPKSQFQIPSLVFASINLGLDWLLSLLIDSIGKTTTRLDSL